jgi:hypothetical protein
MRERRGRSFAQGSFAQDSLIPMNSQRLIPSDRPKIQNPKSKIKIRFQAGDRP